MTPCFLIGVWALLLEGFETAPKLESTLRKIRPAIFPWGNVGSHCWWWIPKEFFLYLEPGGHLSSIYIQKKLHSIGMMTWTKSWLLEQWLESTQKIKIKIHVNKLVGFWLPGSNFADAENGLTSNVFHVLAAALPLNKNQLGHHQHTSRSQIVQVSDLMDPSQGHLL